MEFRDKITRYYCSLVYGEPLDSLLLELELLCYTDSVRTELWLREELERRLHEGV